MACLSRRAFEMMREVRWVVLYFGKMGVVGTGRMGSGVWNGGGGGDAGAVRNRRGRQEFAFRYLA